MMKYFPVLRVDQLDSGSLDGELVNLVKGYIKDAISYFRSDLITRYDPELSAVIKYLLWKFSVSERGSTVGQSMLGIQYMASNKRGFQPMTSFQKNSILFSTVILTYFHQRVDQLLRLTSLTNNTKTMVLKLCALLEKVSQFLSLCNFLVFLQSGTYSSVIERVLGLRQMFQVQPSVRQISFSFLNRELLWHGFAEFVFFIVPLVNIHRLKNVLRCITSSLALPTSDRASAIDPSSCVYCLKSPTHPQKAECGHIFCYYCLKANTIADPTFQCPQCASKINKFHPLEYRSQSLEGVTWTHGFKYYSSKQCFRMVAKVITSAVYWH